MLKDFKYTISGEALSYLISDKFPLEVPFDFGLIILIERYFQFHQFYMSDSILNNEEVLRTFLQCDYKDTFHEIKDMIFEYITFLSKEDKQYIRLVSKYLGFKINFKKNRLICKKIY